eukprot:g1390.t1
MTSLLYAQEASRTVLLKCCSLSNPTLLHRKVVRCLTQIYSSLDRVQKFSPFLLNCTMNTLDSLTTALDMVSNLTCAVDSFSNNKEQSSETEDTELTQLLAKLWKLYMDLDVGLRMQEATTPAAHMVSQLKCKKSRESPRVKSPLAQVSKSRFQYNDIVAE